MPEGGRLRGRGPRYPAAALALQCFHLAQLLEAGVALVDALDDVARLEPRPARRTLWLDVRAAIDRGESLSGALAVRDRSFDAQVQALCRAGEADGTLAAAFGHVELLLRQRHERAQRLRMAIAYPVFAAIVLAAVVLFLFGHVVPSLAAFMRAGDSALAWHTSALLWLAAAVGAWAVPLTLLLATVVGGFGLARRADGRLAALADALAIRWLPLARVRSGFELAGYASTAARLYEQGVELVEALALAEAACSNRVIRRELGQARLGLVGGDRFARGLVDARHLPPTLGRFVAAGESAGALGAALTRAGLHLEREASHALERVERLVGPVLLCATGAVLLWIVVSVLLPVYDVAIRAGGLS